MDTPESWGVATAVGAPNDTNNGRPPDEVEPPHLASIEPLPRGGRNAKEKEYSIGVVRLHALKPYAQARLGLPVTFSDQKGGAVTVQPWSRSLRKDVGLITQKLGCGVDLIYEFVNRICEIGPQNVRGQDLLKSAPDGGRGELKFGNKTAREVTMAAIIKVCVKRNLTPGRAATTKEILKEIRATMRPGLVIPSADTVSRRSRQDDIEQMRREEQEGDHMHRVLNRPDEIRQHTAVVVLDATAFTSDDPEETVIHVVDDDGHDLGILNALFGVDAGTRGLWTWLGFPGAANCDLTAKAIVRGLCDKVALAEKFKLQADKLPLCGLVGTLATDNGKEFVGQQVQDGLTKRAFPIVELSPKALPYYHAKGERLNRTAHQLFQEFLASDLLRGARVNVVGKPRAVGIRMRDVDPTLTAWVVTYHDRPHKGLGGATPIQRFWQMVRGTHGFPVSGLPQPAKHDQRLEFDFMWKVSRVVNHVGIELFHRRYSHFRLKQLFLPGRRSSAAKVSVHVRRYDLAHVYVEIPQAGGQTEILAVPFVHENDKLPLSRDEIVAATHITYWEWMEFWRRHRDANVATVTPNARVATDGAPPSQTLPMPSSRTERRKVYRNRAVAATLGSSCAMAQKPSPSTISTADNSATVQPKTTARPERPRPKVVYEFDLLPTDSDFSSYP